VCVVIRYRADRIGQGLTAIASAMQEQLDEAISLIDRAGGETLFKLDGRNRTADKPGENLAGLLGGDSNLVKFVECLCKLNLGTDCFTHQPGDIGEPEDRLRGVPLPEGHLVIALTASPRVFDREEIHGEGIVTNRAGVARIDPQDARLVVAVPEVQKGFEVAPGCFETARIIAAKLDGDEHAAPVAD